MSEPKSQKTREVNKPARAGYVCPFCLKVGMNLYQLAGHIQFQCPTFGTDVMTFLTRELERRIGGLK